MSGYSDVEEKQMKTWTGDRYTKSSGRRKCVKRMVEVR